MGPQKVAGQSDERKRVYYMQASIWIARPPEEVWGYVTDYANDPEWRRGVSRMLVTPPGEAQVGTTTEEEMRFLGQRLLTRAHVTVLEPGRSIAFESLEGPYPIGGRRSVEPEGSGTRFTAALYSDMPRVPRWQALLMTSIMQRQLRGDVARAKARLEGKPRGVDRGALPPR